MTHVDPFAPAGSPLHPANARRSDRGGIGREDDAPQDDGAQDDAPQDDKPTRRGRRKATPEELEAARLAALARLDGTQ